MPEGKPSWKSLKDEKKAMVKKPLNEEDGTALWKEYTKDVRPIAQKKVKEAGPVKPPEKKRLSRILVPATPLLPPVKQSPELDARTESKLRRGKMEIEGRLDLHGFTEARAHEKLNVFLQMAFKAKKRCVLVITGKGKAEGTGVIKRNFPHWLSLPPLNDFILKHIQAAPKDGGAGAFYVYLKRQRD
jgi:DNA-nicking Smr family endonuclease